MLFGIPKKFRVWFRNNSEYAPKMYSRVSGSIRNNDHRPDPGVMSIRGVLVYGVLVGSRMLQETGTGWMVYKYSVL